ncbi:uncharacterized protein [Dermacentor albipictus]|uniref:uncharacterized protein n=1 Tax=Dermacentor albipictus TaxID=60249 RepID=UPI0038FD1E0D
MGQRPRTQRNEDTGLRKRSNPQDTLWTASIPERDASDITTTIADAQDHMFASKRRAFMTRPEQTDVTSAPPPGYISHADGDHIRGPAARDTRLRLVQLILLPRD